jgi:UDP-glucose 6-dehydrogenase
MISFSTVMKIFTDSSLTSVMRRIEKDEVSMQQNKQEEAKQQQQQMQAQIASNERMEQMKMQIEDLRNQRDNDTKIQVALIGQQMPPEEDDTSEYEKIQIQKEKIQQDFDLKMKDLNEKGRHNLAVESIQRSKPQTSKN